MHTLHYNHLPVHSSDNQRTAQMSCERILARLLGEGLPAGAPSDAGNTCPHCSYSPLNGYDLSCPNCHETLSLALDVPYAPIPPTTPTSTIVSAEAVIGLDRAQDMSYIWKKPPNFEFCLGVEDSGVRRHAEMWDCCDCGNSLMSVANNAKCHECSHTKCDDCKKYEA